MKVAPGRIVAIIATIAALLFLLWLLRGAMLLVFGAILLSLFLDLFARAICRMVPIARGWALAIAGVIVLVMLAGSLWIFGYGLSTQIGNIVQRVRVGEQQLKHLLASARIDTSFLSDPTSGLGDIAGRLLGYGLNVAEVSILVIVMAIFLAAEPGLYSSGLAALVPTAHRQRTREILRLIGASLRLWLVGQLMLMLLVGILTFLSLSAIGVPNASGLALIAAMSEAIPYLGPFVGAVPAILVALSQSLALGIWTALIYLVVHLIEGYLVGPILQRWFVRIPPALILFSIFACQVLFGFAGVILAAPLAVAVFTAVKVAYIRDILHRPTDLPEDPVRGH